MQNIRFSTPLNFVSVLVLFQVFFAIAISVCLNASGKDDLSNVAKIMQ